MDDSQKALILLNGIKPPLQLLEQFWDKVDCRICADGAANVLRELDLMPDVIIGDFDSASTDIAISFPKARIIRDQDQNKTDGEKALNYCVMEGYLEVVMLGALGHRLDHELYNVSLLKTFKNRTKSLTIYSQEDKIRLIDRDYVFTEKAGTRISLMPVYGDVTNVVSEGLKYPLTGQTLKFGVFSSPSNELITDEASLKIGTGELLVVIGR